MMGRDLQRVKNIKYLGIILSEDISLCNDINHFLYSQIRFFLNFNFVSDNILYFLFKSYSMSFYGMGLWIDHDIKEANIRKIAVGYHKAVKRLAGMCPWDSNHEACQQVGVNIFRHLLTKRMMNHFYHIANSNNKIFRHLRQFYIWKSHSKKMLKERFRKCYGVENFYFNDTDAMIARIDFIERN